MIVSFDDLHKYAGFVLVDGAFDPIHAGHVAYLHAARSLGKGPTLCAVASDDQIRDKGRDPLLPQASRVAVLEALCDVVYAKDRPTEQVIERLRPSAYVKGGDWENRLPPEQVAACARVGAAPMFVYADTDSSTARLRAWALRDAERSLDRLETVMLAQSSEPSPTFDTPYFTGDWRADGNTYTYEIRKQIEGKHPALIRDCFPKMTVLDVGCGPGFLVRMLKELGVDAGGCDPSNDAVTLAADRCVVNIDAKNVPSLMADVVVCREVLEHVPVYDIPALVADLFRIARKAVYITTRFHGGSIFDVTDERDVDPTHCSLLTQAALRNLCVLNGGARRRDWEAMLDWQQKGRVLCYEVVG